MSILALVEPQTRCTGSAHAACYSNHISAGTCQQKVVRNFTPVTMTLHTSACIHCIIAYVCIVDPCNCDRQSNKTWVLCVAAACSKLVPDHHIGCHILGGFDIPHRNCLKLKTWPQSIMAVELAIGL